MKLVELKTSAKVFLLAIAILGALAVVAFFFIGVPLIIIVLSPP